jgi:uncharacterized protein (DUF1015 family)
VAVIRPFRAVRPAKDVANIVASVPYDVVNRFEAAKLAEDNELSFLRITRSELELPDGTDPYSKEVYERARDNFIKLRKNAPLLQDEQPHYYLYRLKMGSQSQVGIAATFSVNDYNTNVILKHEKTRKVKEDDRTNHIVVTQTHTGAVFLTYRGVDEINDVVNTTMEKNEPIYDFTSSDGIIHTIWMVPNDFDDIINFEIGKIKNLYIADGHHRAASAGRAQRVMQDNNPQHNGTEDYNYFMAVLFPAEQLKILPYNRVVMDLNGNTPEELLSKISENFIVELTETPTPEGKRIIKMYLDGQWYKLKPKDTIKLSNDSIGENLDVSILQNYLLTPFLGIKDPRTDKNIDFIGGIRGTAELENLVKVGIAKVAFSMYPVSIEDLINISDAGEIMPPKSTWFEPKLRDGLLTHTL